MHWYDGQTGEPRYETTYADGRPGKTPDLLVGLEELLPPERRMTMTRYERTLVLRTVAITLALIVALLLWAKPAQADTGFLVDEYVKGSKRYCVYDVLGDEVIITVDYADLCPVTVEI